MENSNWEYSAFISYKHGPDEKMAREIQNEIERYIVPFKWRESPLVKGKNLKRVFRDSTELSGESDLTQAVKNALNSSAFLIVIVSEETKKSTWVPREIESFLEHHTRQKIIVVLVGEKGARQCCPDILLKKENQEGIIEDIEPLAVDYRGFARRSSIEDRPEKKIRKMRNIKRSELPRILAPMLGVAYNDLVQRRKNYERKRNIAIIVSTISVLAFGLTYVVWNNVQIRNSYKENLRKQSVILASESKNSLDNGDRKKAIENAVEALPDQKRNKNVDMPVTPEAICALNEALNTYVIPGNSEHYVPIRKMVMPGGIERMVVSDSGDYILGQGSDAEMRIYDVNNDSYKDYTRIPYADVVNIIEDDDTYYVEEEIDQEIVVTRYDFNYKNELFRINLDDYMREIGLSDTSYYNMCGVLKLYDDKVYLSVHQYNYDKDESHLILLIIDSMSGKVIREKDIVMTKSYRYLMNKFEGDSDNIVFSLIENDDSFDLFKSKKDIYIYNLKKESGYLICTDYEEIHDVVLIDGQIYVVGQIVNDEFDDNDSLGTYGLDGVKDLYKASRCMQISKFDNNGKEEWRSDFNIDTFSGKTNIIKYNIDGMDKIAVTISNKLLFFDKISGDTVGQFVFPARILDSKFDKYPKVLLSNGELGFVWNDSIEGDEKKYRADNLVDFDKLYDGKIIDNRSNDMDRLYYMNDQKEVTIYEQGLGDNTFMPILKNEKNSEIYIDRPLSVLNHLLIVKGNEYGSLSCIDINDNSVLWTQKDDGLELRNVIGHNQNFIFVYGNLDELSYIFTIDIQTGEIEDKVEVDDIFNINNDEGRFYDFYNENNFVFYNDSIYCCIPYKEYYSKESGYNSSLCIKRYNVKNGKMTEKNVDVGEKEILIDKIFFNDAEPYAIIKYRSRGIDDGKKETYFLLYDFTNEEYSFLDEMKISEFENGDYCNAFFYDNYLYTVSLDAIRKYNYKGEVLFEIGTEGKMIGGVTEQNDNLYTLWNSREIRTYSLDKGELIDSFDFLRKTPYVNETVWHFMGDRLILECYSSKFYSGTTYVINLQEKKVETNVYSAVLYHEEMDRFVISDYGKTAVFKHHGIEELLDIANEKLEEN